MNFIFSVHNKWISKIFNGTKSIEFRKLLPKDIHRGDKIYFYETSKNDGIKKVVGECTIDKIIKILSDDGKWPTYGCYPFMEYYFGHIKHDGQKASRYKSLKAKFKDKFKRYKYGYIIRYIYSPEELRHIYDHGCPLDLYTEANYPKSDRIIRCNDLSYRDIEEVDSWLEEIGFYDDCGDSKYRYGIVFSDVVKYDAPKSITEFQDKNHHIITKPPQSWMYTIS